MNGTKSSRETCPPPGQVRSKARECRLGALICAVAVTANAQTIRHFAEDDQRPVETIVYKQVGGLDLRLLVCKPDSWAPGQRRAAMLWVHGGGFTGGKPEAFLPHMKYSAARGAVAFGVQYRLMKPPKLDDETKRQAFLDGPSLADCIADCADAVRYLRAHAAELGVAPDRISAIGDSAGAYLAASLCTLVEPEARANAVIACSSISDLTTGFGPDYIKPDEDANALSPLFRIPADAPPFLILHGANDWLKDEPARFYDALQKNDIDCELKTYALGRHAFIVYGYSATDEQITRALLDLDAFLLARGLLDGPHTLEMPPDATGIPEPPLALPQGARGLAFDNHGNYWTLVDGTLNVLPAQDQQTWVQDELSSVPAGKWRSIAANDDGHILLSDKKQTLRMNPHKPDAGWAAVEPEATAAAPAWQQHWRLVARMPSGTHDLSGDVLDGTFYMDWAITGDFGYPSIGTMHAKLLAFDSALAQWRIVADYGLPRGYCAVGVLDGKIWTVSGAAKNPKGKRYASVLSQVYDPASCELRNGPDLPVAIPAALGLGVGKRLYVLGFPAGKEQALKLYSIGTGEDAWRAEPDGPVGAGSSYGTALDGKIYTVVPHTCIAIFDTATGTWETTEAPHSPRSPAISHYRGEIWVMGGRTKEGGKVSTIYNPGSNQWRKGPDLPCELVWGCAFNIAGDLYLNGGASTSPYRFSNRTFKLRQAAHD